MDETPSPENTYSRNGTTPINSPFRNKIQSRNNVAEDDGGLDQIECTGKSCKSCTGGVIADCVAVSCCPYAVLDILAFTFLKIPYLMGRKWLSKGRMKIKSKEKKKRELIKEKTSKRGVVALEGRNEESRRVNVENDEEVGLENEAMELGNEEVKNHFSAQDEEMFWLELYRIGHLGFGRVSFSSCGSSQRKTTTH